MVCGKVRVNEISRISFSMQCCPFLSKIKLFAKWDGYPLLHANWRKKAAACRCNTAVDQNEKWNRIEFRENYCEEEHTIRKNDKICYIKQHSLFASRTLTTISHHLNFFFSFIDDLSSFEQNMNKKLFDIHFSSHILFISLSLSVIHFPTFSLCFVFISFYAYFYCFFSPVIQYRSGNQLYCSLHSFAKMKRYANEQIEWIRKWNSFKIWSCSDKFVCSLCKQWTFKQIKYTQHLCKFCMKLVFKI